MIEPKQFYRELDSILARINKEKSDKNFFYSILLGLEQEFGKRLNIAKSHVYEQRGDEFVLISSICGKKQSKISERLPAESEVVQLVLKNGSYVYDNPNLIKQFGLPVTGEYLVPAAIDITSPDRQWLFVFELRPGWIREEIILFINSVRTAMNYRLFSDMMGSELERVRQIQRSLFPRSGPSVPGYQIASTSQSAEIVGGDLYDYFQFEEDNFLVCLGDASGHGLPAALLVRDVVVGLRMGITKEMRLTYILQKLNQMIQRTSYSTNYVTLFLGEIEKDGHMIYVNAGHPPPFMVSGNRVLDLDVNSIPLGLMPDIQLHRSYIKLEPHSVLVLYTDGIVERQNSPEDQFGIDRLKQIVVENQQLPAKDIVKMVFDHAFDFAKHKSWEDDASVLIIKNLGV
jgi:sigma-B regulation protein RsbU (phosphoserine phosphatase)